MVAPSERIFVRLLASDSNQELVVESQKAFPLMYWGTTELAAVVPSTENAALAAPV